jgi:hypothetical protein
MQIDKQSFPINVIQLTDKKVLVQSDEADKEKDKNIIIGSPRTSKKSQGVITH